MPRAIMDYSKTNIYKIVCNDLNVKECYVGHTTDMTKRKCGHKTACNNEKDKKQHLKIYKIIRENGGWENWDMVLVEKFPCKDKYEACKREREVLEELDAKMNTFRPYRTQEEYKDIKQQDQKKYNEKHKEERKEYHKQYREENKDILNEKGRKYRQEHQTEIAEIAEKRKEKIECKYCSKRLSKGSMYYHIKICKSK